MDFSISKEVSVFLASIAAGVLICIVYDLFRVIRLRAKTSAILTDVQDILFWVVATVVMFFVIFHVNNGAVRWYQFFGAVLGAVVYLLTASRFVLRGIGLLIDFFTKIFVFFLKILLTPLLFTYNIIHKCIVVIFVPIYRLLRRLYKKLFCKIKAGSRHAKTALIKK